MRGDMNSDLDTVVGHAANRASDADVEDLLQSWSDAREDAADAYAAWQRCGLADRTTAYHVYIAASDREAAAERLCLAVLQLRSMVKIDG